MDRNDWIVAGSGLLIALMGIAAIGWSARARAEAAWNTAEAGNQPIVDLWYSTPPAQANSVVESWTFGHVPPTSGACDVTWSVYDLDNPGEAVVEVGQGRYVLPAAAANDGKIVTTEPIEIPAIYLRPVTEFVWTRTATQGYRIMGRSISCPAEPVREPPRITLIGSLVNDGSLPFEPASSSRAVTFKYGWDIFTATGVAFCLESLTGKHEVWPTTMPLIVRRLSGLDGKLQLRPDACPQAWKACWPNEEEICP